MKSNRSNWNLLAYAAALLFVLALPLSPSHAQNRNTVDGLIIDIGIVSAAKAASDPSQAERFGTHHPSGAQHLVVSLTDARSAAHIGDAEVAAEIRDPTGKVQKKVLGPAITAGIPDYSAMFVFDWSGKYTIRVFVTPKGGKKPFESRFIWTHAI